MLTRTHALELAPLKIIVSGLAAGIASCDADDVKGSTYTMDRGLTRSLGHGA